jgi:hypothetical protein
MGKKFHKGKHMQARTHNKKKTFLASLGCFEHGQKCNVGIGSIFSFWCEIRSTRWLEQEACEGRGVCAWERERERERERIPGKTDPVTKGSSLPLRGKSTTASLRCIRARSWSTSLWKCSRLIPLPPCFTLEPSKCANPCFKCSTALCASTMWTANNSSITRASISCCCNCELFILPENWSLLRRLWS